MPRHLVDHERSGVLGSPIALCGTELYYLDSDVQVRRGDPCSGRQVVSERERDCKRCLRREAERSETVLMPVSAVAQLANAAPSIWHEVVPTLSVNVVSTVNSQL
jgi:hypothetical protein